MGENNSPVQYYPGRGYAEKKEIIYFDELGFGWVVDKSIIRKINSSPPFGQKSNIVEKGLGDLLRRS